MKEKELCVQQQLIKPEISIFDGHLIMKFPMVRLLQSHQEISS